MFGEVKIKNVGKPISSKLDDKFKSVFRILIVSLDQYWYVWQKTSLKS